MNVSCRVNGLTRAERSSDCHFCLTNISGLSLKSKHSIQYPNLPSALRPIPHGQDLPIPTPPEVYSVDDDVIDKNDAYMEDNSDPDFQPTSSTAPHLISQGKLNDLVRDLTLSKSQQNSWDHGYMVGTY